MYRKLQNTGELEEAFELPFEGKLCEENRWVLLANLIPWSEFKENRGKLLIDATVAPGDIKYPTDIDLLNQARQTTELIIEILYKSLKENLDKKLRTYRKKARKDYLKFAKNRKPSGKERRNAVKKQLQYIKRNLGHIEQLMEKGARACFQTTTITECRRS